MRHRNKGRKFGRNPKHQRALIRMLANSLILTERDSEAYEGMFKSNEPAVKGRIVTTLHKAKEVRPFIEKCVTLARKAQQHFRAAQQFETSAKRGSDEWVKWRNSDKWQQWNNAIAPAVALRRRALQLLHDRTAVELLFDELGPRFEDREGGYTRIVKLAKPRLGDAGAQAILEFVGNERDRVVTRSQRPSISMDEAEEAVEEEVVEETVEETVDEAPEAADSVEEESAEEAAEEEKEEEK